MMGIKQRHFAPLERITLEHLVPQDHFYRHVERTLDLSFVRALVAPFYAAGGARASIRWSSSSSTSSCSSSGSTWSAH
jgi:hypothetical protein